MNIITILENAKEQLADSVENMTCSLQIKHNMDCIDDINEALKNPMDAIEDYFQETDRLAVDYVTKDSVKDGAEQYDCDLDDDDVTAVWNYLVNDYDFTGEGVAIAIQYAIETLFPEKV